MNAIALRKAKLQGSAVAERNFSVTTQKASKSTSINSKEGKYQHKKIALMLTFLQLVMQHPPRKWLMVCVLGYTVPIPPNAQSKAKSITLTLTQ